VDRTHDSLGREVDHTEELTELERALSAHLAGQMSAHADAIRVHARAGRPAEEIMAVATEIQADRIIVGRHSREGTRPDILGSVPMRILQLARCDVLVVQPNDYA
jgi:nucleotide-binding universal stress UspA family protein